MAEHKTAFDRRVLPVAEAPFGGTIGETYAESTAAWPERVAAPEGAPNIVIILLDDVGFGQVSTFGGPVPTPNLDKLAANGLKYNRFHTTAICGPSRAALMTGRNHHNCGSGFLAEWATGFPSYNNMIPASTASVGRILKGNGYLTSWFGKNHNTPDWESSVVGPFDRWPTGMGFDYFFGFIGGETHQYYPVLFENTTPVEPDKSPEEGYHFMTDMTDRAIDWLRYTKSVSPDKPFLMNFAPGAAHAPHHAPADWRAKFKGHFKAGWDQVRDDTYQRQLAMGIIPAGTENTPRPDWVPAWDSLTDDERKLYAALFENFAAFLSFTDQEVGRLLDAIAELPDGDNTLIFYIVGDNGASSEGGPSGTINEVASLSGFPAPLEEVLKRLDDIGGPDTEPHYPVGWAWAGNAPFQWVKQVASHFGGTRNPMVVSWPARITPDPIPRPQFTHLIDILPTILDMAGIPAPIRVDGVDQKPMDGVSIAPTFESANAKPVRERQYFEIFSNRAIYDKGWIACAQHTFPWLQNYAPGNWDKDKWELYNIDEDFSEAVDLAEKYPEKLTELKAVFAQEAKRNNVYPMDDRGTARLLVPKPTPFDPARTHFTYYSGALRLPETASPNTKNKSHSIIADIDVPASGGDGVIVASGGMSAGFSLFLKNGKLVYHYNFFEIENTEVATDEQVPQGRSQVRFHFAYDGGGAGKGGVATLWFGDRKVGEGRVPQTVAARFGIDTFGIGADTGSPVCKAYQPPFKFMGHIHKVDIILGDEALSDGDKAMIEETNARVAKSKD